MTRRISGLITASALLVLVIALSSTAQAARVYYVMPYPYPTMQSNVMYYSPTMPPPQLNAPLAATTTYYGPAPVYVSPPAVLVAPRRSVYYEVPQFWSPAPPVIIYRAR